MREFNETVAYGLLIGLWRTGIVATFLGACVLWMRLNRRRAVGRNRAPRPGKPEAAAPSKI